MPRDIQKGLISWDNAYRDFVEASGLPLDDRRTVGPLMRLLPKDIKEKALWEFDKFEDTPMVLRTLVKDNETLG